MTRQKVQYTYDNITDYNASNCKKYNISTIQLHV